METYPVHDYLRSRLCTLYEKDSIFDRFECGWNGDDSYPNQICCYRNQFMGVGCNQTMFETANLVLESSGEGGDQNGLSKQSPLALYPEKPPVMEIKGSPDYYSSRVPFCMTEQFTIWRVRV